MKLEKVDLNLFVVFDAIYRERSVTKVAVQLNLTQPAVSNALSRLRQTFDDPLFVRTPEGMMPSPVADTIVGDIREALSLLGQSVSSNAHFDPASSEKVFRLGMNDLAEALLLPRLQAKIKQRAPKVSITSYYVAREEATQELKAGLIDLLLDAPTVNAKSLRHQKLSALPYVVAMRKTHPLAEKKLSVEDYLQSDHLHVSSRRTGRGQMDIALHAQGYQRNVRMRVQSYLVAGHIAEDTDLLWTVPKVLADRLPLLVKPLPFKMDQLQWHLYWHEKADNDPASLWIRETIAEVVADVF